MGISQQIGASSLIKPGVIDNSTQRPASPYEGQAIYQKDTDELLYYNGTSWSRPWNMPWGMVALASYTGNNYTLNAGTFDLTSMSVTFTAVANRNYRCSWNVVGQKLTNQGYVQVALTTSANAQISQSIMTGGAGLYFNVSSMVVTTFASGSQTLKLRVDIQNNSANFYAAANSPMQLIVEDIGPA